MKILLLSMPYGALDRQALGLSLLKARLTDSADSNVDCEVRYFTFPFAELIGLGEYQWITFEIPYTAFAGEWSFTGCLYGERPEAEQRYIEEILRKTWALPESSIDRILRIRALAPHFIEHCLASVPWEEYAMVGFTSTFEQNIASLAIARRIKERHPWIKIVFGGANWEAEMGLELHRRFSFVDFVCSGEAEMSFPALVDQIRRRKPPGAPASIPGIIYRSGAESVYTGPGETIPSMDQLPFPDFSDYFRDVSQSTVGASIVPLLLFESSRGCWWGAISHCTFCGLNGGSMPFRSKSQRRAVDELRYLIDRWRVEMIQAVDNILDMSYFNEMLPALAKEGLGAQIFYEVKANLSRKHLRLLKESGVHRIQPGIESLNDHVLKLMRKGITGLRNIQLLKWCREYGITAEWNLLYGFPGETQEDYEQTLRLLPTIRHLNPPTACGPLRLDRFSPYHQSPDSFGLHNLKPLSSYRHLYPFDGASLRRIAYYFDFDYRPEADPRGFADDVIREAEQWKRNPEMGSLSAIRRPDGTLALIDSRAGAKRPSVILSGPEQAAYELCDQAQTPAGVARRLRELFPRQSLGEKGVRKFLDAAVSNRLMVEQNGYYLNVAIADRALRHELERRQDPVVSPAPPVLDLPVLQGEKRIA